MTNKTRQFIRGMGSAIDLGGASGRLANPVGHGLELERTDAQALSGDWRKLADDFGAAFNKTVGSAGEHVKPK
jgi:hypothetical protein